MLSAFVRRHKDALGGLLVFLCTLVVFRSAPIQQPSDARYTMLLAENLVRHGDFYLERYHLPDSDYRLESVGGHRYYTFPPASSILSIPFVALMHLRGTSAVRPDGTFDARAEAALESALATGLMAAFAVIVYLTARLLLPIASSLAVTVTTAFGTQVFSTISRCMWSDAWATVLIGLGCFFLLRSVVLGRRLNLPILASLDGLAYVVRPTSVLVVAGTAAYLALTRRKDGWRFLLIVAGWLCVLIAYSWWNFHELLPDYYAASRLEFSEPLTALLGNLISPSRGLLVYVPVVLGIGLQLVCYRRTLRFPALAVLAGFVIVAHFGMLSGFAHWWGGHSYGARLTGSLVPWFVLLGILALDAARPAALESGRRPRDLGIAVAVSVLAIVSLGINSIGAFSEEAQIWNLVPDDIDGNPSRLWSWRRPQFLAPFLEPGPFLPLPEDGLRLGTAEADEYLGRGWSFGEGEFRWTEGRGDSIIRFGLADPGPGRIELNLRPYLAGSALFRQRLGVSLNGFDLGTLAIAGDAFAPHEFAVRRGIARRENVLRLHAPDATAPARAEPSGDRRTLGFAVSTIRWRGEPI
jgi:hypothetical protein